MNLDDYKNLFLEGKKSQTPIEGICGRILRGKSPEDFETLTDDPDRKIIMLMGGDGLEKILGKTGYETLIDIGYMLDYIEYKVKSGFNFKIVIFNEGELAKLATWENLINLVSEIYPDVKEKIEAKKDQLKNTPFLEIEKSANRIFNIIDKKGPEDPNFMTYKRFKESEGTLVDIRAFLYHAVHIRELYSGDGYTYDEDGQQGLKEYIAPNCKLEEFGEYYLIDLNIKIT